MSCSSAGEVDGDDDYVDHDGDESSTWRHAAEVIAECPAALQVTTIVMETVMSLAMLLVAMMFHCQNSD